MSTTSGISSMRAASVPKVASGQAASSSPQQNINNLFQQIDSAGSGRITKAQFQQAFNKLNLPASIKGIGQEAAYSKLDPSGSGVVSKQDFIRGMHALMAQKTTSVHKEISPEIKATPTPKSAASNPASPSPITNMLPQTGNGTTGNTINITA